MTSEKEVKEEISNNCQLEREIKGNKRERHTQTRTTQSKTAKGLNSTVHTHKQKAVSWTNNSFVWKFAFYCSSSAVFQKWQKVHLSRDTLINFNKNQVITAGGLVISSLHPAIRNFCRQSNQGRHSSQQRCMWVFEYPRQGKTSYCRTSIWLTVKNVKDLAERSKECVDWCFER